MVAVPAISESSGIAGGYVSIVIAGVAILVAVVVTRAAKFLNAKKAAESK